MLSIGVILAGGSGQRMESNIPKQFLSICGKPVIEYSFDVFNTSKNIDQIVIVCHKDYMEFCESIMPDSEHVHLIEGGSSRNESTLNAICFLRKLFPVQEVKVFFHDAARPNVSLDIIKALSEQLDTVSVAVPVCEIKDTIYKIQGDAVYCGNVDRKKLVKAYTPQAFRLHTIEEAYRLKSLDVKNDFTDDVIIVDHYLPKETISLVKDNPWNIKLTVPDDFKVLESLLKA